MTSNDSGLRTALQIALQKAETYRKLAAERERAALRAQRIAAREAEWAKRLDPASWRCHRSPLPAMDGSSVWVAEWANQRFEFGRGAAGDVECLSHSGALWTISGGRCDCPAAARAEDGRCKHLVALEAVGMAARMERETAGKVEVR